MAISSSWCEIITKKWADVSFALRGECTHGGEQSTRERHKKDIKGHEFLKKNWVEAATVLEEAATGTE